MECYLTRGLSPVFYYIIHLSGERHSLSPMCVAGLSLIFEVGGDIQKIAEDSSGCSEVNMLALDQSSRGYTSEYEGKIPGPRP